MNDNGEMDEETLMSLYAWVDGIPLSKAKSTNFAKDFSDGQFVAEIVMHFLPHHIDRHNYRFHANGMNYKELNWRLLNKYAFSKMGFQNNEAVIKKLVSADKTTVENFLIFLRGKINQELAMKSPRNKRRSDKKDNSKSVYQMAGSTKGKNTHQTDDNTRLDRYHYLRPDPNIEHITMHDLDRFQYLRTDPNIEHITMHDLDRRDRPTIVKQKIVNTLAESDSVPRILYEDKERESKELDEKIEDINYKINALEKLINLKDMRIMEAEQRIDAYRPFEDLHRKFVPQQMHEYGDGTFRMEDLMTQQKYQ